AWVSGDTDMDPATFRAAAHAVVDVMADYLERLERYPVLPPVEPGSLRPLFPSEPPEHAEPLEAILADYRRLVEPSATQGQAAGVDASARGLPGRDVPELRVYASAEAHSSIDKALMTLGLGRANLVRVETNDRFEMRVDALEAAIAADRAAGRRPIAIVAT